MPSLDDYQIPHDPNSTHQLHWKPGTHGKGALMPDGTLHTWPTNWDRLDGEPNHRHYLMERGYDDIYDPGTPQPHLFWIYPEGQLETLNHGESWGDPNYRDALLNTMQQLDPRLGPFQDHESWDFGKTADIRNQQRGADELLKLLTGDTTPAEPRAETPLERRRREWAEERARERAEYEKDPIGYEQRTSWDKYVGDGDTRHHQDVEWVPTHELAQFMEYDRRPGGEHSHNNVDRWNALKEHIKANGFNNPVQLEFNPDTGHAHMGEGNHRTAIGLELGVPAMPVRVNRSRRTSPTQIPVNLQRHLLPSPNWVPDSLKPSHIGLTTVPPPEGQEPIERRTARIKHFYHVAPTHARESIQRHGLRGHLTHETQTPWTRSLGQPPGNYMFEDFNAARQYAGVLGGRMQPGVLGPYPGDIGLESYYDHGVYPQAPGQPDAYIDPRGTPSWSYHEDDESDLDSRVVPYDHENAEHRNQLPPHLQGFDIWRVDAGGIPMTPDPENWLADKGTPGAGPSPWNIDEYHQRAGDPESGMFFEDAPDEITDPEPARWMTHEHVPVHRMDLHHHIPAWEINDEYMNEASEATNENAVPRELTYVHPRDILPGRVPEQAQRVWGPPTPKEDGWDL